MLKKARDELKLNSKIITNHFSKRLKNSNLKILRYRVVIYLSLIAVLFFTSLTCKKETPTGYETKVFNLELEDVSCTEAWLRIKVGENLQPRNIILKRDDTTILNTNILTADTLILDEGLLPNRTYRYTLMKVQEIVGELRRALDVSTMDTTSHDFTWQIWTFGTIGSSSLYDVAIIDENNIWAVGEINIADTSINGYTTYNAVHWNGSQWKLKRIPYNYQGSAFYHPIQSIFTFSSNDIWFCGNGVIRWNGQKFIEVPIPSAVWGPYQINKLWGSSSSDLYAVGNNGNIAHWDGRSWRRLESGTELDIYDIYGDINTRTGEVEIYAVAAKQFVTFDKKIFKIAGTKVSTISSEGIPYSLHGIWFKAGKKYYVVGSGMYEKRNISSEGYWQPINHGVTQYYTYAICGNDINDVFVCGSFGELLHFNGVSWHSYRNTPEFFALEFYEISCFNNLIIAVGYVQRRAVAVIGRRTP